MLLCYLDESGDEAGVESPESSPLLVIGGIIVDADKASGLIHDFLHLKAKFFPRLAGEGNRLLDRVRFEVKGSSLRKQLRNSKNRNARRFVLTFLGDFLDLIDKYDVLVVGEVRVKTGSDLSVNAYALAVAAIARRLELLLGAEGAEGLMVLDSRTKHKNVVSVHSLTTRRFKQTGDAFPHLVDSPVFGHSDSHVLLQVADILTSGLLFPMHAKLFSNPMGDNIHMSADYQILNEQFGARLATMAAPQEHHGLNFGLVRVSEPNGKTYVPFG